MSICFSVKFAVVTCGDRIDWSRYCNTPTLVLLSAVGQIGDVAKDLIAAGRSPETPVAMTRVGTTTEQQTITSTLARIAAERGASMVVLPEYSSAFTDPLGPELVAAGEALDGPFVTALAALARELRIHLVAGMVEAVDGRRIANTLVALDPEGALVARYRKLHLYDAFGQTESEWVAAGEIAAPETF